MTAATTSANKKSYFSARFMSKLSDDMKLFISNLFFQLLCLPVIVAILIRVYYYENHNLYYNDSEYTPFIIIAVISFCLSIAMGIVIPMMNFRYLYNKSLVDMNYSLPLTHRQRFLADFFSGLSVYIIPALIGAAVAGIELLIGSAFIDMSEVLRSVPDFIRMGTVVIMGMILLYAVSVFAISFAGSTFEALFSIAAVNIMIPSFISVTWINIVKAANYGLTDESIVKNFTFFTTSPIGVFGYFIHSASVSSFNRYSSAFTDSMYTNFMLRTLLFTAAVVFITYLLYRHRKAEDVSKPYVYKAFYYAIMSVAVYCIFSLLNMTKLSSGILAAFIISGILWFVMEVIRRRGFKRFWTAAVSFGVTSAAVLCVIKAIDATHGLGRAKATPSASSVTDVEIELFSFIDSKNVFHDKQIINDAIELNKELVDRHFRYDEYEYELSDYDPDMYTGNRTHKGKYILDETDITITYYTGSGSAMIRTYLVPSEMLTKLVSDIITSEEYADQTADELYRRSLRKANDEYYAYYDEIDENEAKYCSFNINDKVNIGKLAVFTAAEGKELTEAIRRDIIDMTPEDLRNSEYYCELENQIITSAFKNTIDFFEKHDVKYKKNSEELIDEIDYSERTIIINSDPEYIFPKVLFENNKGYGYIRSYEYDTSSGFIKLTTTLSTGAYSRGGGYESGTVGIDSSNKKAAEQLLEIASPVVAGEKVIAEIQISNAYLYIPDRPGYRDIVESAKAAL
ncbi:hypothetical protein [Ruminococcus sp.]